MNRVRILGGGLAAAGLLLGTAGTAGAAGWHPDALRQIGSFSVPANLPADVDPLTPTSAEIIDLTKDGRTAIYTDSLSGRLGFIDLTNPYKPAPGGSLLLDGEPTSVAVAGRYALVAVNTSVSFTSPSGNLLVLDTKDRSVVTQVPLAGQPDSVAVSPDGKYAAVVIENERDEDVDGGLIPQAPAGTLQVLRITGAPDRWAESLKTVDLTGLSTTAPDDPEPEFVDINRRNEAVVTLQENNWLAIVDVKTGKVKKSFSAGSVTLTGVDSTEEELGPQGTGLIELTDTIERRREPDAVGWIDDDTFATANEGDYEDADGVEGGSRGFTLFHKDGTVEYESGASLEQELVRVGHFPARRAGAKGVEPEGIEVAKVHGRTLLFVGTERANAVGVYDVTSGTPQFLQILPSGIGPEGLRWVPSRNLFVITAEVDGADEGFLARPLVTVYAPGEQRYPEIASADDPATGLPIPWVALSGLAGDRQDANTMWAVSDSFLAQGYLYKIGLQDRTITQRIPVGGPDGLLDLEGVATRPEGGFWVASEGRVNAGSERPNQILRLAADGSILDSIPLPAELIPGATSSGLEGVTVTGTEAGGDETVYVAIQRGWADDPAGLTKLGRYDVATGAWTFAHYPLDAPESPAGGVVGLSEITVLPDGHTAAIIERDDQLGGDARIKRITGVDLAATDWRALDDPRGLATVDKTLLRDALGDLDDHSISVPDKVEGLGVTKWGEVFLVTDNDGVDENLGETLFSSLGNAAKAFGPGA